MWNLKLSWVFLLNCMCSDKLSITMEEVERLAHHLEMSNEDVKKFLKVFTLHTKCLT